MLIKTIQVFIYIYIYILKKQFSQSRYLVYLKKGIKIHI
jgi:hypothetical protein